MRDVVARPHVSPDARGPRQGDEGADALSQASDAQALHTPSRGAHAPFLHIFQANLQLTCGHFLGTLDAELGSRWIHRAANSGQRPAAGRQAGCAGCGNSASGLTTGATPAGDPAAMNNDDPDGATRSRGLDRGARAAVRLQFRCRPSSGPPICAYEAQARERPANNSPRSRKATTRPSRAYRRPGLGAMPTIAPTRRAARSKPTCSATLPATTRPSCRKAKVVDSTCGFFGCAPAASPNERSTPRRCSTTSTSRKQSW